MPGRKGILGVTAPKHQMLFMFRVPEGEEWPSTDSEDSDYDPGAGNSQQDEQASSCSDSEQGLGDAKSSPSSTRQKRGRQSRPGKQTKKRKVEQSSDHKGSGKRAKKSYPRDSGMSPTKSTAAKDRKRGEGDNSALGSSLGGAPVSSLPPELWLKIFKLYVQSHGTLPFLCRAAKVSRLWYELTTHPSLWQNVDLSYGWIKSSDRTLKWLAQNRLSQCREVSLAGWKNLTNDALTEVCGHCPDLEVVNLSHCPKLTSVAIKTLATRCPRTRDLDLSFMSTDAVSGPSVRHVAESLGAGLTSLIFAGNMLKSCIVSVIVDHCPNLDTLDLSNCRFSTDYLILNVEKLQAGCPLLRVLRLANCKIRPNQISNEMRRQSPGFPRLQQLSCAMPATDVVTAGIGPTNDLLKRLLCKTHDLHLLDLRGCSHLDLWTLLEVSIPHLQELYLARTPLPREPDDALYLLLGKLCHSLKILDLSWTSPDADSLENGIDAMSGSGYCPLTHCNFAGSTINLPTVELLLMDFTLQSLDLTSCRSLPRGIKCLHEGPAALQRLRASIRELMATHSKRVVEDGGSDSCPHF